MLLFLLTACKKNNVTTNNGDISDSAIVINRIDSVLIQYLTISNIKKQLRNIPDTSADSYFNLYVKELSPSLTNKGEYPFFFKIQDKVATELDVKNGKNPFHFILSSTDNKLDILYMSPDGDKYVITEVSKLTKVTESDFIIRDSIFKKNIYAKMNRIKMNLVGSDPQHQGDSSYGNTTDIIIPYDTFKSYVPNNGDSALTLFPGIISDQKTNSTGKSKKFHFTLIMAIYSIDSPAPTIYYDDFCLKPPGC